jgi:hypothetical protein
LHNRERVTPRQDKFGRDNLQIFVYKVRLVFIFIICAIETIAQNSIILLTAFLIALFVVIFGLFNFGVLTGGISVCWNWRIGQ